MPKKSRRTRKVRTMTLSAYLGAIKKMHNAVPAADWGACLIKDQQTGGMRCIRTSEEACKALSGTYIGGPCS